MAPEELRTHIAQQASSERAPSEPAGRPMSLDVATCSLPVSSAKVLAIADEIAAFAYESNSRHDHCAAIGLVEAARSHKEDAFAYEWCATMLRRHAASMTERQPEENVAMSHAASDSKQQ